MFLVFTFCVLMFACARVSDGGVDVRHVNTVSLFIYHVSRGCRRTSLYTSADVGVVVVVVVVVVVAVALFSLRLTTPVSKVVLVAIYPSMLPGYCCESHHQQCYSMPYKERLLMSSVTYFFPLIFSVLPS